MADYSVGVYNFDPYFTFSRTVGGSITYSGPTNSTGTATITDNGTGIEGASLEDDSAGETATVDVTVGGNTSTGVDVSAEEVWTVTNTTTGETFQMVTFHVESGPASGYYTLSEQPLVVGHTYETVAFDSEPDAVAGDPVFSFADYVSDVPDGTVDGTDGDDVIDTSYTGDPQDEVIDGEDNPDHPPIDSVFSWEAQGADELDVSAGVSDTINNINVNISFVDDDNSDTISLEHTNQHVNGDASFDTTSGIEIRGVGGVGDTSTTTIDFSAVGGSGMRDEVKNVEFFINDLDSSDWEDIVTVRAFDADGNEITVNFTILGNETLSGNTITAGAGNDTENQAAGSVQIQVEGPVSYIEIDYNNGGTGGQKMLLTDIHFKAIPIGANDDVVDAGAGNDSINSGVDTDTVFGGAGNDTINASADDDTLYGGDDADTFQLESGFGNDSIVGGEGGTDNDRLDATTIADDVTVTFSGDEAGTLTDGTHTATFSEIEGIALGAGDDTINGAADTSGISVDAGAGEDSIIGGSGGDTIAGGAGDDTINGGAGGDTITGGAGDDTVVLTDGFGSDDIDGGSTGESTGDKLDASDVSNSTTVTFDGDGSGTLTDGSSSATFSDMEIIETGNADDTINASADTTGMTLIGGGGDDDITGGSGDDVIYGDGGGTSGLDAWQFEYYDLDPTGNPQTLSQAGFTLNGGRDHSGTPTSTGYSNSIDPTDYDTGNDYALKFTTQINITTGGTYTFETNSDDGSKLFINGVEVVDNDGHHGAISETGTIDLTAGTHVIEIVFYENDGANTLTSSFSGPDTGGAFTNLTGYPNLTPVEPSGGDTLNGGAGDDSIFGGDDADTIILQDGFGNDTIEGGEGGTDTDTIDTSAMTTGVTVNFTANETGTITDGTDTATFSEIEDIILTDHDDSVNGTNLTDDVTFSGGAGDDTLTSGSGDDTLYGGTGADTLSGGDGTDALFGGTGNDTLNLADGDTATGGDGDDTFILNQTDAGTGNITITGGEGNETAGDTLNFNGTLDKGTLVITDDDDANGGLTGYAFLLDGTRVDFTEIENIICFARGTQILTHTGERAIEELAAGDMVLTLDHGLQQIRWIGARTVPATGDFAPITIDAGVLGNHTPLTVSPQHRMLISGSTSELLFGEKEVLIPAKHLLSWDGIHRARMDQVEYFHILFDTHQLIHANGAPSESFHPGEQALDAVTQDARDEILKLFPELADMPTAYGPSARVSLKGYEAEVLGRRMA